MKKRIKYMYEEIAVQGDRADGILGGEKFGKLLVNFTKKEKRKMFSKTFKLWKISENSFANSGH